jgi:hypothetical protein
MEQTYSPPNEGNSLHSASKKDLAHKIDATSKKISSKKIKGR